MVEVAKIFLKFFIVFLILYFLNYIFGFKKLKNFNRKKMPNNLNYLVVKYNINVVKIGYKKVYKSLMLADSFIISFLFILTEFIKNVYIRMLVCFILIFPFFAGVYYLISLYYRRKED